MARDGRKVAKQFRGFEKTAYMHSRIHFPVLPVLSHNDSHDPVPADCHPGIGFLCQTAPQIYLCHLFCRGRPVADTVIVPCVSDNLLDLGIILSLQIPVCYIQLSLFHLSTSFNAAYMPWQQRLSAVISRIIVNYTVTVMSRNKL